MRSLLTLIVILCSLTEEKLLSQEIDVRASQRSEDSACMPTVLISLADGRRVVR